MREDDSKIVPSVATQATAAEQPGRHLLCISAYLKGKDHDAALNGLSDSKLVSVFAQTIMAVGETLKRERGLWSTAMQ